MNIDIISATISDYPIIQNLARFYVYDRSGFMGWGCEPDGMFECIDFKHYFTDPNRKAFVIKVEGELAGFVLLDKEQITGQQADWNMGEFFIIAKFQGKGVANYVADQILSSHSGRWTIAVMPENLKAVKFWKKAIGNNYSETFRKATNEDEYDMRVFSFEAKPPIVIRETNTLDYPAIVDIGINAWREAYKDFFPSNLLVNLNTQERLDGREKFMAEPQRYSYVAMMNNEIVGYVDFGISRRPHLGIGEIYSIYTKPNLKGYGIGSKLMHEAITKLEEESLLPYIVSTLEKNLPAQHFYEKLGMVLSENIIMTKVGDKDYPEVVYKNSDIVIQNAKQSHIPAMVKLSYKKRKAYEIAQPQFWKYAENAEKSQTDWFEELLDDAEYIMLVEENLKGFIIGRLIKAPEVYNPGGLTLMIDDFCVVLPELWQTVGVALVSKIKEIAKAKGAAQLLVVSGDHDIAKNQFLESLGLTVASRWYMRDIK